MPFELHRPRCVLCGWDVKPARIGLTASGAYDPDQAPQHALSWRIDRFGGRARITTTHEPLPLTHALGVRAALKAALARVEAEIVEATGQTFEDGE